MLDLESPTIGQKNSKSYQYSVSFGLGQWQPLLQYCLASLSVGRKFKINLSLNTLLSALVLLLFNSGSFIIPLVRAEESHPGMNSEAEYMEAVLAYNRKDFEKTLRILDKLLKQNPNNVEALELKALSLKTKNDDAKSLTTYVALIKLKPAAELGPYFFETAAIYNRQKKFALAKENFNKALNLKFNEVASHLFLGLIAFGESDLAEAEIHFKAVKEGGNPELKVVGRYYLGLTYFKSGLSSQGTTEIMEARDLAATMPENKMATDIKEGATKILKPFTEGTWFANLTALGQYDTNISQVPLTGSTPAAASGMKTSKIMLMGGVGKMTAPLAIIQWVPSYRFSGNRNINSLTHVYEFFTNTASVYMNYRPLAQTTAGLKLEGNFTFQNQFKDLTSAAGGYVFRKYNVMAEFGPIFKTKWAGLVKLEAEVFGRPQKVFESELQSGNTYLARTTLKNDWTSDWANPTFSSTYELSRPKGTDYHYNSTSLSFSNLFRLFWGLNLSLGTDYSNISYFLNSNKRIDKTLTYRSNVFVSFKGNWSLMTDFSMVQNRSTVAETYSYDRIMAGFGVTKGF